MQDLCPSTAWFGLIPAPVATQPFSPLMPRHRTSAFAAKGRTCQRHSISKVPSSWGMANKREGKQQVVKFLGNCLRMFFWWYDLISAGCGMEPHCSKKQSKHRSRHCPHIILKLRVPPEAMKNPWKILRNNIQAVSGDGQPMKKKPILNFEAPRVTGHKRPAWGCTAVWAKSR